MADFTPGPWYQTRRTVYALNEKGYNKFSAWAQDSLTPEEELEANARLMAAAPDLYKALKDLMNYSISCSPELWRNARIAALNALRRAEGNKEK